MVNEVKWKRQIIVECELCGSGYGDIETFARRIWEAEYVQYLLEESKWLCEEIDSGRLTFEQIYQHRCFSNKAAAILNAKDTASDTSDGSRHNHAE